MSIIIKGMKMPKHDGEILCIEIYPDGTVCMDMDLQCRKIAEAKELPPHGRLIDAEEEEECAWIHKGGMIYCPECAEGFDAIYKNDFKYCPNCGVKKEGVKE